MKLFSTATFIVLSALLAAPAFAHPLGNFTINHLSELAVRPDRVTVRYVLDLAEIPTYAVMREASASAKMSPPQLAAWANAEAKMLAPQLQLSIDGRPQALTIDGARATTRPGAGGLPLLYLVVDAHAPLATGERVDRLTYTDATYHGRIGWKDAILAPQTEPTHELTAYPSALLGSPRQRTGLAAQTNAAGVLAVRETGAQSVDATAAGPAVGRSNQLSDMLAKGTGNPGFILLTLLVAIGLGALHALEPGHGKTLLAVSLVGARATVKQASILAGALTIAHTAGVIALGFAILLFKGLFVPEAIYPWITLISGIAVAVIGARAIARQVSLRVPFAHEHAHAHAGTHPHAHDHAHFGEPDHGHGHGAHAHGHGHGHEPAHTHDHDDESHARQHAIPGSAPLKFGATVWAAMSGGVAPCPAALVVLLAAVALGQVGYGLVVIVAFSLGLAITLTGLGIGVVRGAQWLSDRPAFGRAVQYGPIASACAISLIGAVMLGQGLVAQGVQASPLLIAAIALLAILGYAFSHPFMHARAPSAEAT